MGFTITEAYQLPGSSVAPTNLYITIRARQNSDQNRMHLANNEPYIIASRFYVLGHKNDSKILHEQQVIVPVNSLDNLGDYVPYVYNYLKTTTFSEYTCVDDL